MQRVSAPATNPLPSPVHARAQREQALALSPDPAAALTSVLAHVSALQNALARPPELVGGITDAMLHDFLAGRIGPTSAEHAQTWFMRIRQDPINGHTYGRRMALLSNLLAYAATPVMTARIVRAMGQSAHIMCDARAALDHYLSIPEPPVEDTAACAQYFSALADAACVYGNMGNAPKLRELGTRILRSGDEPAIADYYLSLVECCAQQGHFDDVRTAIREVREHHPVDSYCRTRVIPIAESMLSWENNILPVTPEYCELLFEQSHRRLMGLSTAEIDEQIALVRQHTAAGRRDYQ